MTTKKSTTDKSKSPNFTATIPVFFATITLFPLPKELGLLEDALGPFAKEPSPFEKLQTIHDKALELSKLPYDEGRGWPANVHSQAKRIVSQAKECITALEGNDVVIALAHGYQLGGMIQKISTHLALYDSFNHQKKARIPRSEGGKTTADNKAEEAAARTEEIVAAWGKLDKTPERDRVGIIARSSGVTATTVRRHLKKANIR